MYHGSEWVDTNGDGYIDSQLVDLTGDGQTDLQLTDVDYDGVADIMLSDTNGDGVSDVEIDNLGGGSFHTLVDSDADGIADMEAYTTIVFPGPAAAVGDQPLFDTAAYDVPTVDVDSTTAPDFSHPADTATGPFPAPSSTQLFLDGLNQQMGDAATVYHSALNPHSVSPADLAAAEHRIDNTSRNSALLAGDTYARSVSNSIHEGDIARDARDEASRIATDTAIDVDRETSRAEWAVYNSRIERGL
jgi:hypothetical protein